MSELLRMKHKEKEDKASGENVHLNILMCFVRVNKHKLPVALRPRIAEQSCTLVLVRGMFALA